VNQSHDLERTGRWLDQQVILRWMFILRQVVAFGIFVVALLSSEIPDAWRGTLASPPVVTSVVLTAISISWTELRGEAVTPGFLYAQFIHDFLLLTEAVHLTGGGASQLSALYILWMSAAALLLPLGGSLLLAALASALFVGDALLLSQGALDATLVLQLLVFVAVAFGTGAIATRLQAGGGARASRGRARPDAAPRRGDPREHPRRRVDPRRSRASDLCEPRRLGPARGTARGARGGAGR